MDNKQFCDVLRREINIVDYARSIGLTPVETPTWRNVTHRLQEHDSVRINALDNVYYRNSTGTSGGIIDFCMEFGDGHGPMSQNEAIRHLRQVLASWNPASHREIKAEKVGSAGISKGGAKETPPFELPPRSEDGNRRLFAYLCKTRCLDAQLVGTLVKDGMLYQDDRANVVFCGQDYDGEFKNAAKRTTNTNLTYRGDAAGSNKEIGFSVNLVGGAQPRRLFVAESPIDILSLATLVKQCKKPPLEECGFLSLNGVAHAPLSYHLPHHTGLATIYLCQDNDAAGNEARVKMREQLQKLGFKGEVIDKPSRGKDFNEDLCELTRSARAHHNKQSNQQTIERGMQHELG